MTKDNNRRKYTIIKLILLVIMIIFIVMSIIFALNGEALQDINWDKLNPSRLFEEILSEKKDEEDVTIRLEELELVSSTAYMGDILILTDNDIRLLDAKGDEQWYLSHDIRQPVLQAAGRWILIYDYTGKSYIVINYGKKISEGVLGENISFGDICEDYILFITWSDTGYKRTVHLVSPESGIKLGTLYIDDFYPYYSVVSAQEDEGSFILSGLSTNSSLMTTILRKYSSNLNAGLIADVQLEGIYPVILDNPVHNLFISETACYCYNNDMDYLWSIEFDAQIAAAGIFADGGSVFALDGLEEVLCFYDSKGKELNRVAVNDNVQSIVTYKNTAAAVSGSEASFYSASGKFINKASIPGLTAQLHFIEENKVYLISENEAFLYNLKMK